MLCSESVTKRYFAMPDPCRAPATPPAVWRAVDSGDGRPTARGARTAGTRRDRCRASYLLRRAASFRLVWEQPFPESPEQRGECGRQHDPHPVVASVHSVLLHGQIDERVLRLDHE